jgi:hypothetical protein
VATFLLVIVAIADLALAALLVAVSGFMFGAGPESMHAGNLAAAGYVVAVIGCVAAPIAGFFSTGAANSASAWLRLCCRLSARWSR